MALSTACPKPPPRVLEKAKRAKAIEAERIAVKRAVWQRDKATCRVCGKPAEEMHELRFRSLGGRRSLENSIAVCTWRGHNCHRLLQSHAIEVEGTNANQRLIFRWAEHITERPFRLLSKRRSQNR